MDTENAVVGSLRIADIGVRRTWRLKVPEPEDIAGLSHSTSGGGARLSKSMIPKPRLRRAFWFTAWDNEAALDTFETSGHESLAPFANGWSARLDLIRAWHRDFPIFSPERSTAKGDPAAPLIVLTMNQTLARSVPRFLRMSAGAEGRALDSSGFMWGMGFSRPPRSFATMSVWNTPSDIVNYAYRDPFVNAHQGAVDNEKERNFFARTTVLRFRPYAIQGELKRSPALPANLFEPGA